MIELRNISKKFGSFTAVDNVSLSIKAGEFLTLLGPSGCGKTTLLRMISGFESPDTGTVLLSGQDVTASPPYRREVNQVFQSYALFPHLSVAGNIAFGLRMRRMPRLVIAEKVATVINMMSLTGMEHRMPTQLSGGQRQRVALARALVCEPKVLLLDEPLAALDAKLRRAMQIELKGLQTRVGITFVFVTHDQEEAITMSDRIAVMNYGRIEQLGSPTEVYHRPVSKFVATFLGQTNLLTATVIDSNHIRLRDGTVLDCDVSACTMGENIVMSVRPEHVGLSPVSEVNVFPVKLVDRAFKGAFEQLQLKTSGELDLLAVGVAAGIATGEVSRCQILGQHLVRVVDTVTRSDSRLGNQP